MPDLSGRNFNKEKLIFLGGSALVAAGMYLHLMSGPIALEPVLPFAYNQRNPVSLKSPQLVHRQVEDFYVVDGKVSKLIDLRTDLPVNRERLSPFEPFKSPSPPVIQKLVGDPILIPDPPTDFVKRKDENTRNFAKVLKPAEVKFMGVMAASDGEPYGLLKPNDGSPAVRVKKDSVIMAGGERYTVTALEKQAILVVDGNNDPYTLKDSMFEEVASPDFGSSKTVKDIASPARSRPRQF